MFTFRGNCHKKMILFLMQIFASIDAKQLNSGEMRNLEDEANF